MNALYIRKFLFGLFLAVASFGLFACSDSGGDDDKGPARIGPKVQGENWTGFFFNTGTGEQEPLTATITHTSNEVVIVTTKANPPGQRFTGTIDELGAMELTDSWDGETWTTFFGVADDSFVKVADFARKPEDKEEDILVPIQFVELRR